MNGYSVKQEQENPPNYHHFDGSQYAFASPFFYPYMNIGMTNKNFKEMNNKTELKIPDCKVKIEGNASTIINNTTTDKKSNENEGNAANNLMNMSRDEYMIVCDMCDFQSQSHREMDVHRLSHGLKKSEPMPTYFPNNESEYENPMNEINNRNRKGFSYVCDSCPYSAKTSQQLLSHKKSHSEEKAYTCNQCPYRCKYLSGLKYHQLSHNGTKLFECDECKFSCWTATLLKSHKRKHSNIAPYACRLCSYRCKYPAGLRYHLLTHTKGKDISCDMCSYTCRTNTELKIHVRKHVPQPLTCEYCGFSCKTKKTMSLHTNSNCRLQMLS